MSGGDNPRVQTFEMVAIASRKLTKKPRRDLEKLLVSRTTDESTAIMTAILACRLALCTGPFVQLTHELVAYHMMTVQRAPETLELHAHYPSEPILAEASAQFTARHGWAKPLEALMFLVRHELTDKGYRGELICKVLLLMAMEDCLRHKVCDRSKNFKQSRPVSLRSFLSRFLNCGNEVDSDQTTPPKTKTSKRPKFDDWDSDEEDDPVGHTGADLFPPADCALFFDLVNESVLQLKAERDETRRTRTHDDDPTDKFLDKAAKEFMSISDGWVNFNHFISTNTTITTALLLHAWNRCAAFMTKPRTHGIDLIIPVLLADKELKERGPLFGPWTEAQYEAAGAVLAYIVIDAKNWLSMTQTEIQHNLDKCWPMDDNFTFHTPVNPFISIVQSVGDDDPKHQGVRIHMLPPILDEWKEGKQFQLQVSAVGLTSATYTCLENRPDTIKVLKRLRNMTLNPFRGLSEEDERRGLLIDTMSGQVDEARQTNMRKPKTAVAGRGVGHAGA